MVNKMSSIIHFVNDWYAVGDEGNKRTFTPSLEIAYDLFLLFNPDKPLPKIRESNKIFEVNLSTVPYKREV